jgi:hypothetical protein
VIEVRLEAAFANPGQPTINPGQCRAEGARAREADRYCRGSPVSLPELCGVLFLSDVCRTSRPPSSGQDVFEWCYLDCGAVDVVVEGNVGVYRSGDDAP